MSIEDIKEGKHYKDEPDILFKNKGVELGAIVSNENIKIDKYEINFLEKANELIKGKIPPNISIPLLFQEDKEYEIYYSLNKFKRYKYITKYLSKMYIEKHETPVKNQISIAQGSSRQIDNKLPSVKKQEMKSLISEIIDYVDNINPNLYICWNHEEFKNLPKFINQPIWNRKWRKRFSKSDKRDNPIDNYFSDKIIDKFKKDKYVNGFDEKVLLLHNYTLKNSNVLSTNNYFYTYYRNNIFNKIFEYINKYKSFEIYDKIYFVDFSTGFFNINVKVIDFSSYKILSERDINIKQIRNSFTV